MILKPNRGGKGLGVRLFQTAEALAAYVAGPDYEAPVDGLHLFQQYIRSPDPLITRAEFIGGSSSTRSRSIPAMGSNCARRMSARSATPSARWVRNRATSSRSSPASTPRNRPGYKGFLARNGIEVAGIEFIRDDEGRVYTYDVNTNTNYNPDAEAKAGKSAMRELARFFGGLLG